MPFPKSARRHLTVSGLPKDEMHHDGVLVNRSQIRCVPVHCARKLKLDNNPQESSRQVDFFERNAFLNPFILR
jgi:hypothetical protein